MGGILYEQQVTLILGPVSFISLGGYTLALNYFEPHIVGNAFVAEPLLSQLLGCLSNQDRIPGVLTFVGGAIAMPAIIIVAKGSHDLMEKKRNKLNLKNPIS